MTCKICGVKHETGTPTCQKPACMVAYASWWRGKRELRARRRRGPRNAPKDH